MVRCQLNLDLLTSEPMKRICLLCSALVVLLLWTAATDALEVRIEAERHLVVIIHKHAEFRRTNKNNCRGILYK